MKDTAESSEQAAEPTYFKVSVPVPDADALRTMARILHRSLYRHSPAIEAALVDYQGRVAEGRPYEDAVDSGELLSLWRRRRP